MLISTNSGLYSAVPGRARIPMADTMCFLGTMGFEAVDVNFSACIYEGDRHEPVLDGDFRRNLDEIVHAAKRNGLTIAFTHLPFYTYHLPDQQVLARNEEMMYRAIEATAYIGAPYAVIHPYRDVNHVTDTEKTIAHLTPFRDKALEMGVALCIENMKDTAAHQLCEIVDALDAFACWDVGHANLAGFDQGESIRTLGSRLKTLHLHDNYGTKDDHSLPFLGTVDWQGVMEALADTQFPGVFNYEVSATNVPLSLRKVHAQYLMDAARLLLGRT